MKSLIHLLFCSLVCYSFVFYSLAYSLNAQADIADISRIYHSSPTLASFEICHSGGCADVSQLSLSDSEWQQINQIFAIKAVNAAQERSQIAMAIGALEKIIGLKIGTSYDLAGTFDSGSRHGQLDCNDEAINSTTYMRLLKLSGFMPFHAIEDTRTRNFFFNGWPHSTAVMRDIKTGERFAVDSWFYDNGAPATIVPFALWKSGYIPADSPIRQPHYSQIK